MYKIKRRDPISIESSYKNDVNYINCKRLPLHRICFYNPLTGQRFYTDDVKLMVNKRNNQIDDFFKVYSSESKFTMIEFGFDFEMTNQIDRILVVVRRNLKRMNLNVKGFVWLVDKGEKNGNMHFHLTVATEYLNFSGKQLPKQLKMTFKNKKIHSEFVEDRARWKKYLKEKDIMYIGRRKRVFSKSRKFIK